MPLPSWLRRDLALMTNRFPLSPKYRDFINSTKGVRADFLEGTTASGKTTVGAGVKFMAMVSASPKKLHIIASKTTGTAEKNILQQDNGILDLHRTARYYGGGDKDFRLPHIKFEGKIIFVLGYDNRDKWKLVLGAQFGCVYIDEINTADIDFVREISTRNDYLMATLNPDDPSLPVYKEFVNRSRPYRKYAGEVPPEILAELKEPAAPGWRYWFFTFRDNLSLSEDDISRKMEAAPKGTKLYKNKILGLRGRATGLVFSNFERQRHCISRTRAKALVRQQKNRNQTEWFARFSAALDTSYSQQSPDTIAMSFIGITNLGRCILLAERVYNNAQLREPLAPSDTVREFRAFLDRNRQEWGVTTVILNKRGNPCPLCRPFCGKVFIDDVWSGGSAADGDYPLLSEAIEQGLYHPRCRDSHTTYFPELEEEAPLTKAEERRQEAEYEAQQKETNARRQGEKYDRLAEYSLDPENRRRYQARAGEWEKEKLILSKSNRDKPVSLSFSKKKQQSAPEWNKAIGPEIWPTKQRKAMWSAEWGTTGKRHEEARLYDAAGKRLFHKKGGAQEVQFTTAEIKQMRGGVLTHNHPGLDYGCFSPNDINMLRYGKLSEMRCVTPKGVFRIQHPGKWSKEINSLEKIESAYYDISNNTDGRFFERARLGEISFIDAENMAQEATVRELCNRFGIPFEFESWDSIREAIK